MLHSNIPVIRSLGHRNLYPLFGDVNQDLQKYFHTPFKKILKIDVISYSTFRFPVMLNRRYRVFPYISCPHSCMSFPLQHHPQNGAFVTTDESTVIHHYSPKTIVSIMVSISGVLSMGLDKCYNSMYPLL